MEVRDLLTKYEYPGDKVPVIKGSALKAIEGDEEAEKAIRREVIKRETLNASK